MEIEFKILKEDLVNFHMNHVTKTNNYRNGMIFFEFYLILLFGLVFIITKRPLYLTTVFLTDLVFFLFRKKLFRYKLRKKFLKLYSFDRHINEFEYTKLITNEDGLKSSTSLCEKIYKWKSIRSIHLVDNYIFIITTNNDDLLIPIKEFATFEIRDLFLDNITKKTGLTLDETYPVDIKYI